MFNARPMVKAFATNLSATALTKKVAQTAKPSGNGVLELGPAAVPRWMRVFPYGLGSDNDVYVLRITGWHRVGSGPFPGTLWFPETLAELTVTISTFVGVAGSPVLATERFADTIVPVATIGEPTIQADVTRFGTFVIFSPANDTPAWVKMSSYGCELLQFDIDQTTGTPTGNALLQFLDDSEC